MTVIASSYINHNRPGTVVLKDVQKSTFLANSFSTTVALGTADATRRIIVLMYVQTDGTSGPLVDSITLGGSGMSLLINPSGTGGPVAAILAFPSGTSATLAMTRSTGAGGFFYFGVFAAYDINGTVFDSHSQTLGLGPVTYNTSVPFQGIGINFGVSDGLSQSGDFSEDNNSVASGTLLFSIGTLSKQLNAGTRAGTYSTTWTYNAGANALIALSFS